MRHAARVGLAVVMLGMAGAEGAARAGEEGLPEGERKMIEALIEGVKKSDLKFVREEKVFDAKAAAWYLRYRWNKNRDRVKSVQDFVDLVSVGGEKGEITYYVQFPDGVRKTAREVLEAKVKEMRERK